MQFKLVVVVVFNWSIDKYDENMALDEISKRNSYGEGSEIKTPISKKCENWKYPLIIIIIFSYLTFINNNFFLCFFVATIWICQHKSKLHSQIVFFTFFGKFKSKPRKVYNIVAFESSNSTYIWLFDFPFDFLLFFNTTQYFICNIFIMSYGKLSLHENLCDGFMY